MAALPQFAVLQSQLNSKNLQFVKGTKRFHGYIQASGDTVVSPFTKLEIEVCKNDESLVHIKNCYSNKYWIASSDEDNWIVAGADVKEEDETKLSCTLFQPTSFVDENDKTAVRLMHVNLGKYLSVKNPANQSADVLILSPQSGAANEDLSYVFTVFDWSSIVLLPRDLGFKVQNEDKYLAASPVGSYNYMKFIADNKWSPAVRQEVTAAGDGCVMVKSVQYGKYWVCADTSIILAKGNKTPTNDHHLFRPESLGTNVIGLLNVGDGDYCKRLISEDENLNGVISAVDGTITPLSTLEVIELVTARLVEDVDFKPLDAKKNATKVVPLDTKEVVNVTTKPMDVDQELEFRWNTTSSTWNSSANGSLKVGDRTGISSKIPLTVVDGHMLYDTIYNGAIVWGEPKSVTGSEQTATYPFKITVPPMTKFVVKAMGNMESFEVPFFYTQTNTVDLDDATDSFAMEDGCYIGTSFTFLDRFDLMEIPLAEYL